MAEKKGLIYKMVVGSDKADGHARSTLPSNRWELLWDILKGRFWKLVILNLMLIVGVLPAGLVFLARYTNIAANGTALPFSGSYIIGYHQIPFLYETASAYELIINIEAFALLIPAIMFATVIFSGVFHIARNLAWSEGVFMANDFWKGLKSNILNFLLVGFIFSLVLFTANLNISSLNQVSITNPGSFLAGAFVNSLFRALTYIFTVFFTIMVMFAFTINVTYKVSFVRLIKNSFILTLGLLARNIFFMAICFAPFLLIFLFPTGMLIGFIMGVVLLLGLSGAVLGWTIYSQWVFDTFLNDKVEGAVKNRGLYQKVDKDGKPVAKKAAQKSYANPKKKRAVKPVTDDDIVFTELPTAFSRADLKRLEDEKEVMRVDSEKWADEHDSDEDSYDEDYDGNYGDDDDDAYEGQEDAMRLDGDVDDSADGDVDVADKG